MRFPTCECRGTSVELQIVEAHVEEETHSSVDFFDNAFGNHHVARRQLHPGQELSGVADREVAYVEDVLTGDKDCEARRLETSAFALRARDLAHVPFHLLSRPVAFGLAVPTGNPRHDAFVVRVVSARTTVAISVFDMNGGFAGTEQNRLLLCLRELGPRSLQRELELLSECFENSSEILSLAAGPGSDRTFDDAHVGVGNDQLGIDFELRAQTLTVRTCAVWRVEGKVSRCQFVVGRAALRARQVLAEREYLWRNLALFLLFRRGYELDLGHTLR